MVACGISNEKVSLKIVNVLLDRGIDVHLLNKVGGALYSFLCRA